MGIKNTFIMILFLLAAQFGAAQEEYVIYEGTQLNYRVDFNNGNTYAWNVENAANAVEFDFTTDPAFNEVGVKWNIAGDYLLRVSESHPSGCSTTREIAVQVQPNNRTAGFELTASTECFNASDNSFALSFIALDNNGQPISSNYFPLNVEFTVAGQTHTQQVSFDNQNIQVNEAWFTVDPTINTVVSVEITAATDVKNTPVKPDAATAIHTRTLFALPEIEFTEELRRKYNLNYEAITAYNNTDGNRLERMEPE